MQGTWLTKTKKAYVKRSKDHLIPGWYLILQHYDYDYPDDVYESFWYPSFELAVRAIPGLWRH